ncbi:TPA: hypothetical protein U2D23_001526 [Streptococcus suis]|nr:hypothetical protein [Streptococcus suis]
MISYILVGTQEEILKEQFTTAKKFNLQEKKQELLDKGYELVEDMISPALLAGEGEDHYLFVREKESIVFPTASHHISMAKQYLFQKNYLGQKVYLKKT